MRTIDVKTPPAKSPRPAKSPSAYANTPRPTKSSSTTEPSALLPEIVEALLHLVRTHRIKRVGSVTGNRHRFRRRTRRNPRNRHTGRRDVAHRIASRPAGRILPRLTLENAQTLKAAPTARIRPPLFIIITTVIITAVAGLMRP